MEGGGGRKYKRRLHSKKSLGSVVALSLLILATVTSASIINEKSDVIFRDIQIKNTNPFEQPDLVGIYNGILYAENNRDTPLIAENVKIGNFNCELSDLSNLGTLKVLAVNVSECISKSGILDNTTDGVFRDVTLTTRDFIATENIYVGITGEHGICGSSKNTCQSGIFASKTDTETHYKWSCLGVGEGVSKQCQKEKPCATQISYFCEGDTRKYREGDCSISIQTRCDYGCSTTSCNPSPPNCGNTTNWCLSGATPYHIPDTQTHHIWGCEDSNGQQSTCRKIRTGSLTITGQCDNKTINTCVGGTLNSTAYQDNQTHFRWRCDGQNGGNNSQMCSKVKNPPENGLCNNNRINGCRRGIANDGVYQDTQTQYRWRCDGQFGGSNSRICSKSKDGVCGSRTYTCSHGTLSYLSGINRWRCSGVDDGRDVLCHRIDGKCGYWKNSCYRGTSSNHRSNSYHNTWTWRCDGQHGGSTASCSITREVNGVCSASTPGNCVYGSPSTLTSTDSSTSSDYSWTCSGKHGGSTASCSISARWEEFNIDCNQCSGSGCSGTQTCDTEYSCYGNYYSLSESNCSYASQPSSRSGVSRSCTLECSCTNCYC